MADYIFCIPPARNNKNNTPIFMWNKYYVFEKLTDTRLYPGNGNRGVGGIFGIPPLAEIFSKIPPPPGDFGSSRHVCFLNERKTLKLTLIQLDLGLIKLN